MTFNLLCYCTMCIPYQYMVNKWRNRHYLYKYHISLSWPLSRPYLLNNSSCHYHISVGNTNRFWKVNFIVDWLIIDSNTVWWFMVFNTTFNNISVISWPSVLLVEEREIPGENHRLVASHWQILSHNVVSRTHRQSGIRTHFVSGDRH